MKIAFFDNTFWPDSKIQKSLSGHTVKIFKEPLTSANIDQIKNFDIISIFHKSKITPSIIKKLPKLKMIATSSTGFDHISLRACKTRKILVSSVPHYGSNTVAEHTFALMLDISRKIHKTIIRTKDNNHSITGLQGFDLHGKTLGIIGVGSIGKKTINIAKAFGMKVIAYDPCHDKELASDLDFKYVSFNDLLKNSNIISLHCPCNGETKHIINTRSIKKMKKSAIIINTARGDLIDTQALINALEKKLIAGAGLDVIENENLLQIPKNKDLVTRLLKSNCIITPHIAFYTKEAVNKIYKTTINNISGFIKKKPENLVPYK